MISIKMRGLDEISQKITDLPRGVRGIATEEAAKALIGNEREGLQYYPTTRPGQTYRRTYNLRFGWRVSNWGDKTKVKVQNDVPYVPYVQGDELQAWMHKGRWRTVSQIITAMSARMNQRINEAVARYLKAKGLT